MPIRPYLAALALLATACGPSTQTTELRSAVTEAASRNVVQAVAFRFAGRRATDVRLYELPSLGEISWRFDTPDLVAARVVGFATDDDVIYAVTPAGQLAALDLESGRARTVDTLVERAVLGPADGVFVTHAGGGVAAVSGRRTLAIGAVGTAEIELLRGAGGDRALLVTRGDSGRRMAFAAGGTVTSGRGLPDGPLALAPWGDAAAVATDSGLVLVPVLRDDPPRVARFEGTPAAVVFSSSGHRVYLATAAPELIVFDRFDLARVSRTPLPAPVSELRADPDGVWLFGRAADGVLLIPQAGGEPRVVAGTWDDDLPAASPTGTILLRRDDDVVALDATTLEAAGRVRGAARDRWLVAAWDARRPALQLAQQRDTTQAATPPGAGQEIFVQVSSTANQQWADDLARDLRLAGMKATVLPPSELEDRYRVVIGPYATRDAAEDTGRKLGMPYWIFVRDTGGGTP